MSNHLKLSSLDCCHCCTYAGGGSRDYNHSKALPLFCQCTENLADIDAKKEVATMIESFDYIQEVVVWYMTHQLKAKMKYCEGQVEYFGKKGTSLLGLMIVTSYKGSGLDNPGGFQYEFVDIVVEG
eukprot:1338004-Ditylum_brightwellii.AAC.1